MDAVKSFNAELSSLYEVKPPISKAKMTALTRGAIKGIKFYKHVVQSVEKFILKCKPEYKVPGLYVIDSIVRQSRHQFGADKDVFAPRFAKNMQQTFMNLFKCPAEDKSKIIRVLNLWQKNQVFAPEVVQPLFDLADPNHPIHKEIQSAAAHQAQLAAAAAQAQAQAQHNNGAAAQVVAAQVAQVLLAGKGSPAIQKTPTKTQQMQQAAQDQTTNNTLQSNMDANTLAQLQHLHRLLLRQQQGGDMKQDGSGHMTGNLSSGASVHFDRKLLDFDYGSDEDDDQNGPSPKVGASGGGMDVGNLLTNPEVLRQLTTLQQSLTQPVMHEDIEKMRKLQQMKQQEDEFDKHLAQTVPNLPFAAECEFKPMMTSDIGLNSLNSFYMPSNDMMMNQPPPGFNLNQQMQQMDDSMGDPEVEFVGTGDNIIEVLDQDSPTMSTHAPPSPSGNRHSPTSNDKHNSGSNRRRGRSSRSRDRSPTNRRSSRRARSRSRSRSRDRSPRRRHRSSRSPKERSGKGSGASAMSEVDRERERERAKRGLPPIKKDNLSVCSTTLWVGHLSKLVHQEEISDTFGEFGEIVTIDMILPRGCAFIVMNRRQDASRCLAKLKGFKIQQKAITLAWAPGKGVKGKDLKDYWEGDLGVSYIPWSKLKPDIDIDLIEDGGMIDEDTAPAWLKAKLDRSANHVAAMSSMKPEADIMTTMPPYLGQPQNVPVVTNVGSVLDTSQPPPIPPSGPMLPGQPMPPLPQLVSPFQLNNRLITMNLPPGLMPNVNIGVPPPNIQNALMTNQLIGLNTAASINAAVAAAAAAQQQQQAPTGGSLMPQLGALGEVVKPPPPQGLPGVNSSVVDSSIPPPSVITTMAQQPSLSETLMSLAQQQPPPQPFLMHHPPPMQQQQQTQDSMDVEMEDVGNDSLGANRHKMDGIGGQSLSDQLLSMQNATTGNLNRPPPTFQPPPPSDNSNVFSSALSRLHAVTNHRNDFNNAQNQNNNARNDSPSRNNRDRDNRDSNRDNRRNNGNSRNGKNFDSRDNNRGRDRDRDNRDNRRSGNRDNRDRDGDRGGRSRGGYNNNSRDSRDDNRRDRRSDDRTERGGDRDAKSGADDAGWIKGSGDNKGGRGGGERNNRWGQGGPTSSTQQSHDPQSSTVIGPDDKEKERKQREKALNDRLREMAGMDKQEDPPADDKVQDRDDRERDYPKPLMMDRPPPLFPDGPPSGQTADKPPSSIESNRPSRQEIDRRNSSGSSNNDRAGPHENRSGRGGRGSSTGPTGSFRRSRSNDDFEHHSKRARSQTGPPSLLDGAPMIAPPGIGTGDLPIALLDVDGPPPDFPPPIMDIPPEFVDPDGLKGIFDPSARNVSEFDGPPLMMLRGDSRGGGAGEERFNHPHRDRFRDDRQRGPAPLRDSHFNNDGPPFNHPRNNNNNNNDFPQPHHRGGPPSHHHRDFGGGPPPMDMFHNDDDDDGGRPPGVFEPPPPGFGGFNPEFGPPPGFGADGGIEPFGEFDGPPPGEFGDDGMMFREMGGDEYIDGGGFGGGRFQHGGHNNTRGHWMKDNDGPPPHHMYQRNNNNFGRPNFPDGPVGGRGGGGNFHGGAGRFGGPPPLGGPPNEFIEFDGPPGDEMQMYDSGRNNWRGGGRNGPRGGREGGGRGGRGGRGGGFSNNNERNKSWRHNDNYRDSQSRPSSRMPIKEEGGDVGAHKRAGTPLRDEPSAQNVNPAPPGVVDTNDDREKKVVVKEEKIVAVKEEKKVAVKDEKKVVVKEEPLEAAADDAKEKT